MTSISHSSFNGGNNDDLKIIFWDNSSSTYKEGLVDIIICKEFPSFHTEFGKALSNIKPKYIFSFDSNYSFIEYMPWKSFDEDGNFLYLTRLINLSPLYSPVHMWSYTFILDDCKTIPKGTPLRSFDAKSNSITIPPTSYKCHKCGNSGHYISDCQISAKKKSKTSCWFCLGESSLRYDLIVRVYKEYYIAFPKESLTLGHLLLIPIKHISDDFNEREEMTVIQERIIEYFKSYEMLVVFLYIKRKNDIHHRHIQCIPLPIKEKERFIELILSKSKKFPIIDDSESYFSCSIGKDDPIVRIHFEGYFPSDFGRECLLPFISNSTTTHSSVASMTNDSLKSSFL